MKRIVLGSVALTLLLVSCGSTSSTPSGPDLPTINEGQFQSLIAASERPIVVNIWASWCIPCRSEAPLLRQAHEALRDEVQFIGVAVADAQPDARAFLAEFGITFDNYFDRPRAIPGSLGRIGVPITFFFAADGSLVHTHPGVIDERTLAINIDEVLAR